LVIGVIWEFFLEEKELATAILFNKSITVVHCAISLFEHLRQQLQILLPLRLMIF